MSLFYPLSDNVKKDFKNLFYVFDVETQGLNARPEKFVFGVIYGYNFTKVIYSVEEFKKEFRKTRYKNKYVFAHNAEYDLTTIYDNIIKNLDNSAIFNGSQFIFAQKDGVKFCDSFNILKAKLSKIGKFLGQDKLVLNNKFKSGKKVKTITQKDIEYCTRDCEIVFNALMIFFELTGDIKVTLASLAMNYFRRKYLERSIENNRNFDKYFYSSYYGGRVECFKIGETYSYKYDINSMYAKTMLVDFPNPKYLRKKKNVRLDELEYYLQKYEGCINCTVEHKKNNFGFLPYRHNGKLIFPYGKFSGTWNFNELRFAIENNMVRIIKCNYIIYSRKMPTIFYEYVRDLYKLKNESAGEFDRYIYKSLLTNLYGKFGQKEKTKTYWFKDMNLSAKKLFLNLEHNNIPYEIIHYNNKRKDFRVDVSFIEKNHYSIPSIASYITSAARIELLKLFIKHEWNTLTYCDTDSICLEKKLDTKHLGTGLGELKLERQIITHISGNKYYTEISEGKKHTKIKGIPSSAIKENGVHKYKRLIKTKESIRKDINSGSLVSVEKKLKPGYDKRINNSKFTAIIKVNE